MKNKTLKILAIIIPVVLIGVMVYLFTNYQNKKAKVEALQSIPTFSVKDINGATITNKDLQEGNKLLVYFNPECHFCQAEMQELSAINKQHLDVQWIMFSSQSIEEIKNFAESKGAEFFAIKTHRYGDDSLRPPEELIEINYEFRMVRI